MRGEGEAGADPVSLQDMMKALAGRERRRRSKKRLLRRNGGRGGAGLKADMVL